MWCLCSVGRFLILASQVVTIYAWGSAFPNKAFGATRNREKGVIVPSGHRQQQYSNQRSITMDTEPYDIRSKKVLQNNVRQLSIPAARSLSPQIQRHNLQQKRTTLLPKTKADNHHHNRIDQVAAIHGMPWKTSIDPTYEDIRIHKDFEAARTLLNGNGSGSSLFYMPFWEWQMDFMKQHLTNLQVLPVTSRCGTRDLSHVENTARGMRMHTLQLTSDEYKCIRLTLLDAGPHVQVFTSVWYPNPAFHNLPVLGADLLQFQQSKHVCISDFQPIFHNGTNDSTMQQSYEALLKPIRDQYPSLQCNMTDRFYDKEQFFSKQMLLGRCDKDKDAALQMVFHDLFPAFQAYVQTHVNLVKSTAPQPDRIPEVLSRHAAYDSYSAARDPAHGMLASAFGKDFANDYVYDVLFPLSERQS